MSEQKSRPALGVEQVVALIDERAPFPIGSILLSLVCGGYLSNPTAGIIELIPDNLPLLGNLDEAAAGLLLAWAISNIAGWWRFKRAQRRAPKEQKEES